MLDLIVIVLLILWLTGLLTSYTMGGLIHVLVIVAIIVLVASLLNKKRF